MTFATTVLTPADIADFADWRASMELMLDTDLSERTVDQMLALARGRIQELQPAAAAEACFDAANLEVSMLQNLIEVVTGRTGSTQLH